MVAEEITQDAFLAAHLSWERIGRYDMPEAWVRRVATNRCISAGRRAITEARLLTRMKRERTPEPSLEEPDAELWAHVRSLPRRQAQVVALTYLEDRSVDDVAEILGCGPETVRTHLRRARAALAHTLMPQRPSTEEDDHA
jgi:RNA polymerase sigma-70 factor (ECF subfamily)